MRLIFWVISLSLIGIASSKNGGSPNISIVGGVSAALGEFPYVCYLLLDTSLCGGSLIGTSHVLTAAHCLYGKIPTSVNKFIVRCNTLASSGSTPGAIAIGVKKFIIHEKYNPGTMDNDVALLVLNTPVTNVTTISLTSPPATTAKPGTTAVPATITTPLYSCTCTPTPQLAVAKRKTNPKPAGKATAYANTNAVIAGWGTTSSGGSLSRVLLKANVTILDNSVCTSQYGSSFFGNDMMCASAPGKDTCQGDSGGPIIVNGIQVGITSWGYGCADPRYAGIYTRVSTYLNWIQTTQANNLG